MNTTLADFQIDFFNAVFKADNHSIELFSTQLNNTHKLDTNQQLSLVTHSIHSTLINALTDIYPVCEKLTGERFFYHMAKHYILQQPSDTADLADYGENFAIFITEFIQSHSLNDQLPYLPDMCQLEWAYHRAFHAKDEAVFSLASLHHYKPEELTNFIFSLATGFNLIASNYPIDKIWQLHQSDNDIELEYELTARYFYLYRNNFAIHIDCITRQQWLFLQAINQQQPFIEVCDQLVSEAFKTQQPDIECEIPMLLTTSIQRGWINIL